MTTFSADDCSILPEIQFIGIRMRVDTCFICRGVPSPYGSYLWGSTTLLGELPKSNEPQLPVCQSYHWQFGPTMWSSPTTKSLDPIIVTTLWVDLLQVEKLGSTTGGKTRTYYRWICLKLSGDRDVKNRGIRTGGLSYIK